MKKILRAALIPLIIFSFLHPPLAGIGEAHTSYNIEKIETTVKKVPLPIPSMSALEYRDLKECKNRQKLCAFRRWLEATTGKTYTMKEADNIRAYFRLIAKPKPVGCPSGYFCWQGGIHAQNPCAIPEYICDRESGTGDVNWIDVKNPGSSASGKYQFIDNTWQNILEIIHPELLSKYEHAGQAPENIQDEAARYLWDDGNGSGHWDCC